MKVIDAATGQPVVATIKAMTDAQAGVPAAESPSYKSKAVAFEVAAPGYEPRIVFQNRTAVLAADAAARTIALCRNGAVDTDKDGLCDDAEAVYGTDPKNVDTDGDSLTDAAEIFGWNGHDMAGDGATPTAADFFLEVDYYPNFPPFQEGLDAVKKAFADSPRKINLIIDVSDQIAAADAKPDLNPVFTDLRVLAQKYRNNTGMGAWAVLGDRYNGGTSSGIADGIPSVSGMLLVSLGAFQTRGANEQGHTLMHELGHVIGLTHGGTSPEGQRSNETFRPNFFSLMSYTYQFSGLTRSGQTGVYDYSELNVGPLNEASFNEVNAYSGFGPTTEQELATYGVRFGRQGAVQGNASQNLDVDKDGRLSPSVSLDANRNGTLDNFGAVQSDWPLVTLNAIGRNNGMPGSDQIPAPAFSMSPDEVPPCMTPDDLK